jgi:hypothetical protein
MNDEAVNVATTGQELVHYKHKCSANKSAFHTQRFQFLAVVAR